MTSRYAILPRSSIEVVHLPFHGGYLVYTRSRPGDPDHKTLYVAARNSVYKIRTNVAGIP